MSECTCAQFDSENEKKISEGRTTAFRHVKIEARNALIEQEFVLQSHRWELPVAYYTVTHYKYNTKHIDTLIVMIVQPTLATNLRRNATERTDQQQSGAESGEV